MLNLHPGRGDGADRKAISAARATERLLRYRLPSALASSDAAHDSGRLGVLQQGKITGVLCETSCVFSGVNPAHWATVPLRSQESCQIAADVGLTGMESLVTKLPAVNP
jgi:hypothetical protein